MRFAVHISFDLLRFSARDITRSIQDFKPLNSFESVKDFVILTTCFIEIVSQVLALFFERQPDAIKLLHSTRISLSQIRVNPNELTNFTNKVSNNSNEFLQVDSGRHIRNIIS